MKLSQNQDQALLDIATGNSGKALLKSKYNTKTIEALECRELISVRDIDGAIKLTTNGERYLFKNHPSPDLKED